MTLRGMAEGEERANRDGLLARRKQSPRHQINSLRNVLNRWQRFRGTCGITYGDVVGIEGMAQAKGPSQNSIGS